MPARTAIGPRVSKVALAELLARAVRVQLVGPVLLVPRRSSSADADPRMLILGADPGFTGAIAFLDPGTMDLQVHDMPVVAETKGKVSINLMGLGMLLAPSSQHNKPGGYSRLMAVIEKVHAMPKQGGSSTFRFGEGYGALQMACAGHGYEMRYVTPNVWKKHFGLIFPKDTPGKLIGDASRGLAIQRFPQNAQEFSRVKDHGRAEAALIALYGAEVLSRTTPKPTA